MGCMGDQKPVHPTLTAQRVVVEMAQEYEASAELADKKALEARTEVERRSFLHVAFTAREIAGALRRAEHRILTAVSGPQEPPPEKDPTVFIKTFIERSPTSVDLPPPVS